MIIDCYYQCVCVENCVCTYEYIFLSVLQEELLLQAFCQTVILIFMHLLCLLFRWVTSFISKTIYGWIYYIQFSYSQQSSVLFPSFFT